MPDQTDDCVESVLEDNPDYSEDRAWAICKAQQEADVEAGSVEAESLETVGLEAEPLDALVESTPEWQRLESDGRVAWVDAMGGVIYDTPVQQAEDTVDELIAAFIDDWEGTAGSEPNISDLQEWVDATDRTELDAAVDLAGVIDGFREGNPDIDLGEATVDVLIEWADLNVDTNVHQQANGFGVGVYRIVQTDPDDGPGEEGDVLGVAVDMPNAGVYVDWNIDAWPDDEQLSEAHVSDYGNIDDLAQVTQGELEPIETVETQSEGGVLISGLSSEALDSIRSKYNAAVKQL